METDDAVSNVNVTPINKHRANSASFSENAPLGGMDRTNACPNSVRTSDSCEDCQSTF